MRPRGQAGDFAVATPFGAFAPARGDEEAAADRAVSEPIGRSVAAAAPRERLSAAAAGGEQGGVEEAAGGGAADADGGADPPASLLQARWLAGGGGAAYAPAAGVPVAAGGLRSRPSKPLPKAAARRPAPAAGASAAGLAAGGGRAGGGRADTRAGAVGASRRLDAAAARNGAGTAGPCGGISCAAFLFSS